MKPMNIKSVNEPGQSRDLALTPASINEPAALPDWAAEAPVITALDPTEATIGDASFTLTITGTGFYPQSVINFAGQDEPTTFADGALSTGVNMDVWHGPDTVSVLVHNGPIASAPADFTFLAAEAPELEGELADPDDLEDEIEAAEEEGDFKPVHRGRPTRTLPTRRKK
jgi:hypothetical protein